MLRTIRWLLLALGAALIGFTFWATTRRPPVEPPAVIASLPDFELTDSAGRTVTLDTLRGSPWIADFIFTRCPLTCPRMTELMNGLGPGIADAGGASRVSISVDPEHDTPRVLADYARQRGISDPSWLFLTGERSRIQALAREGFLLPFEEAEDDSASELILHSTRFILVDAEGRVRGYYDPFEPGEATRLLGDLRTLHAAS